MSTIYREGSITFSHTKDIDPSPESFTLHVHDCYEILCFASGNVKYTVEGREYSMYPGCLMLLRPAETHRLLVNGRGEYNRYVLHFRGDDLQRLGISPELLAAFNDKGLGEKNQYLNSEFSGIDTVSFFRQLEDQCKVISPRLAIGSNLAALLCALNVAFLKKKNWDSGGDSGELGRELIAYINENLVGELSLESVSRHVHMSASQVNRIFRGMTGTSVYDYILSKRLVMAQEMIASGEGAVSASQKCGFRDYSSFYRAYKRRFSTAPSGRSSEREA